MSASPLVSTRQRFGILYRLLSNLDMFVHSPSVMFLRAPEPCDFRCIAQCGLVLAKA